MMKFNTVKVYSSSDGNDTDRASAKQKVKFAWLRVALLLVAVKTL